MRNEALIVSAVRTPMGRFMGTLSPFPASKLGSFAIAEAVKRAKISPEDVEEVIFGQVLQAGAGQNPARQAAIWGGIPVSKGAFTVNKVCGSGLKSVALAAQAIAAGDGHIFVAGGQESMTNAPYLLPGVRAGHRLGNGQMIDAMVNDGLWDIYNNFHMGMTAELVCDKYGVTREDQDNWALGSHLKAVKAIKEGKFKAEIVGIQIPQPKGAPVLFDADEGPREDTSMEKLGRLKAAFKEGGRVTAGNASAINDGASALVVVSESRLKEKNLAPLARIVGYATGGVAPEWVMMAPVEAIKNLLARTSMKLDQFDLIELNEAFAAATCGLIKELKIDRDRVNVHGGAVALGHPIGCSGARILTTLIYALKDRKLKRGLAALCLGGGNAVAMAVEVV
ncbi:MAG: acetyl-CoA C-acetyltransferase [Planctomycetota bacterium]|nr:acetyl-CoA C-acetyltransferase [Planctomycetota bacterium]